MQRLDIFLEYALWKEKAAVERYLVNSGSDVRGFQFTNKLIIEALLSR